MTNEFCDRELYDWICTTPSAAGIEIERLRAELHDWIKANGPGGWIDNFRKRAGYDPAFSQRATAEPQRETKTLTERPERLQTGNSAPERVETCPDLGCQTCYPKRKSADERLLFRAYLSLIRDPRAPELDYLLHDLKVRLGDA